jgi:hypothetical protein
MPISDLLYGRQGGRIVSGNRTLINPDDCPRCDLCDQPMVLGQKRRHLVCAHAEDEQHPQGIYPQAKK